MRWPTTVSWSLILLVMTAVPCLAQSSAFGISVVVDGDELIIAEPNNNFRPGTVYVYRAGDGGWQEAATLRARDAERADGFGAVLALAGDTLFVAQRGGRLHTFAREGDSWRATGTLAVEGMAELDAGCGNQYGYCDTDFGITLAADGDWMMVGVPGREEGRRRGGRGERQEPTPGAVHVFERGPDGAWIQREGLQPSGGTTPGGGFGTAIALQGDRVLVGAPNRDAAGQDGAVQVEDVGRVFEFRYENGTWTETASFTAESGQGAAFGAAIALRGDLAVIGAPGSGDGHGAAWLYRRDPDAADPRTSGDEDDPDDPDEPDDPGDDEGPGSGEWEEVSRLAPFAAERGDGFGSAVAIDGADVWVGAPAEHGLATGSVYLYRDATAPVLDAPERIRLTDTDLRDAFGARITALGGLAVVSAPGMDHQAGSVHVYRRRQGDSGDAADRHDEADGGDGEWRGEGMLVSAPDALEPLTGEVRPCDDGRVGPFDCDGIDLLAFLPGSMLKAPGEGRGVRTNDNWGWTDPVTGREYALIGRNDGTSFFDITDPVNPVLLGNLPKTQETPPSQLWRDIKFHGTHAFIVADGAGAHGMQVFDMAKLRDVPDMPTVFQPDAHYTRVNSVHNIVINGETGFAYLVGSGSGGQNCGGGLHMVDVSDPLDPTFAGCHRDERGTHDAQCFVYQGPDEDYRGRELCLMANGDFLSVSDVTDKESPEVVGRGTYPNPAYLHQGWVTPDHRYFYMDDESDVIRGFAETTRTTIWDLSDVEDPLLVDEFMGSKDTSAHNLYVKGDLMYQANYRDGLHILDISDPENPVEVGFFDTAPYLDGPGFSGAWSNYPFFESGTIIVTSLQEGMFLLRKRE